jgi:hypothetical protein
MPASQQTPAVPSIARWYRSILSDQQERLNRIGETPGGSAIAQVRACPIAWLAWAGPGPGRSSVFAEIEKAVKPDRNSFFADFFKN